MIRSRRNRRPARTALFAGVLAAAGMASASPIDGPGFVVPVTGEVTVTFERQDAGAVGALYLTGYESGGAITPATALGEGPLGAFLFRNRGVQAGESRSLGIFNAGDTLHFLYTIITGAGGARSGDVVRTDDEATSANFRFSDSAERDGVYTTSLGIEDIRDPARADWDFNDVEFTLTTSPRAVPAPGPIVLGACGLVIAFTKRKKRAG